MNTSNQDQPSSLSLHQLLQELENLIVLETQRKNNPWVSVSRLMELFYEKHKASVEETAQCQGYRGTVRNLLRSSDRFSIYGTSVFDKFYVALLHKVHSNFQNLQPNPTQKRTRQPSNISTVRPSFRPHTISKHHPKLVSQIQSVNDLELALVQIIKSLTANSLTATVTIPALSKTFSNYYQQPLRPVLQRVCPGMKLIELLQAVPYLHVQKVDCNWQVAIKDFQDNDVLRASG